MRIPEQYIYHNDTTYEYSELDGAYYPVPTPAQYQAQKAVVWVSSVIAIIGLALLVGYKYF